MNSYLTKNDQEKRESCMPKTLWLRAIKKRGIVILSQQTLSTFKQSERFEKFLQRENLLLNGGKDGIYTLRKAEI